MAKQTKKKPPIPDYIWGLFLLTFSLVLMVSLASFSKRYPSQNWIGLAGHAMAWGAEYLFGVSSFLFAIYLGWMGALLLFKKEGRNLLRKTALFTIFLFSLCSLLAPFEKGGEPFSSLYYHALKPLLGALGSILLNAVLLLTSFYYLTNINFFSWIKKKRERS